MIRNVLVLVNLNYDFTDMNGVEYPEKGKVLSEDYCCDKYINHGLYGTLWGEVPDSQWITGDEESKWKVISVESNSEIIPIDSTHNFIKFRTGNVVFSGSKEYCSEYITTHKAKDKVIEPAFSNYYSEQDTIKNNFSSGVVATGSGKHAIVIGEESTSRSLYGNSISLGKQSIAISGEDTVSVAIGDKSKALSGDSGKSIACGSGSIAASGSEGIAIALEGCCQTYVGENGILISTYYDGTRKRIAVAYAGEDVKPNTVYHVNENGEFVEVS